MKYWLGVASEEHVMLAVKGGFCQLNHGKAAPLRRMLEGEWIIYYSPKKSLNAGEKLQAFTAVGQMMDDEIKQVSMSETFEPFRRKVSYFIEARLVPLAEVSSHPQWKENISRLRFGHFEITRELFTYIAEKMGLVL